MKLLTSVALVLLAPTSLGAAPSVQVAGGGHAALHPADALFFVELPEVQAAWTQAPKAPLARLLFDERVQAAITTLSGRPLVEWLARPELQGLTERAAGLTRGLVAASLSSRLDAPETLVERASAAETLEPRDALALELALEFAAAERASEVRDALAGFLEAESRPARRAREGDAPGVLRFGDGEDELFLWSEERLVRVGFGRTSPERMRARSGAETLATFAPYSKSARRLEDARGVLALRGAWMPGSSSLKQLSERARGAAGAEAERLQAIGEHVAGLLASGESLLAFQMRQHERGFVWESFQAGEPDGEPPPLRALLTRVPADAAGVWVTTIDAPFLWQLAGLVDDSGSLARWSRAAAEAEIDVAGDLLGQLGPGLALYLPPPGGLALPRAQIWIDLADAERFGRALDALVRRAAERPAGAGGIQVARGEYRGHALTSFEPASGAVQPTLAVVDGKLLVMLQPSHVKRFLRDFEKGTPMGRFDERQDVAPRLASLDGAESLMFVDWGGILGGYYRTGLAFASLAGAGGIELDVSALPEPEIFPHYLTPTWRVARRVAGGTHVLRETSFGPEIPLGLVGGSVLVVPHILKALSTGR